MLKAFRVTDVKKTSNISYLITNHSLVGLSMTSSIKTVFQMAYSITCISHACRHVSKVSIWFLCIGVQSWKNTSKTPNGTYAELTLSILRSSTLTWNIKQSIRSFTWIMWILGFTFNWTLHDACFLVRDLSTRWGFRSCSVDFCVIIPISIMHVVWLVYVN